MQESEITDVLSVRDKVAGVLAPHLTYREGERLPEAVAEEFMKLGYIDYGAVLLSNVPQPTPAQSRKSKEKEILRESGMAEAAVEEVVETRAFDEDRPKPEHGLWTAAEVDKLSTGQIHIEHRYNFGTSGLDRSIKGRRAAIVGTPRSKPLSEFFSLNDEVVEGG